jgi:hypothetical protein
MKYVYVKIKEPLLLIHMISADRYQLFDYQGMHRGGFTGGAV